MACSCSQKRYGAKSRDPTPHDSSEGLGNCRCSMLCYRNKEHDGCMYEPPDTRNRSSNDLRENSSGTLGNCRCSKLCYMTEDREGCTNEPPSRSNRSRQTESRNRSSNDLRENSSGTLGNCRCSKLCYMTEDREGCTNEPPSISNRSRQTESRNRSSNDLRENSSGILGNCRCSKLCYMTEDREGCTNEPPSRSNRSRQTESRNRSSNDLRENSSGTLGNCRCSKLCYMTEDREGCTNKPPSRSNRSRQTDSRNRSSNDLRENSAGTLGDCRCSKLCYMTEDREGCTNEPPSRRNRSSNDLREGSSGSLGVCRCSRLCYRSRTHSGCVAFPPSGSGSSRSSNSATYVKNRSVDANENRIRSSSDLKKNLSGSLRSDTCRCSQLCYMTESREGCINYDPKSTSFIKENDIKESDSANLDECECSRLCFISKSGDACVSVPPILGSHSSAHVPFVHRRATPFPKMGDLDPEIENDSSFTRSSEIRTKATTTGSVELSYPVPKQVECKIGRSICDPGCLCRGIPDTQNSSSSSSHSSVAYRNAAPTGGDFASRRETACTIGRSFCDPGCRCRGITDEAPVKEPKQDATPRANTCPCDMGPSSPGNMSAFSLDSTDMRYLEQVRWLTDQDRKLKHELDDLTAQEMAIRNTLKKCDQKEFTNKISGDGNIKILRAMNKDLSDLNESLTDKIQDLHLEQDQISQKINGPLTRELERIRKKYAQLRCEISRQKQPQDETRSTAAEELVLLRNQLKRTQENIADMTLVNDGIKQEVIVLGHKCDQMEKVLIKQKLDEMNEINKLQNGDAQRNCFCGSSLNEKSISSETVSCSCSEA